jgi:thioredoxin-dependent peroxiredoxin
MSERLQPGDRAPDFTLTSADGSTVSLGDFAGENVVVYFYPAAATPGCTTQACDFRDSLASLAAAGYRVIGVSPDQESKLRSFSDKEALTFPLLSDPDHAVAEAWGAWGEKKNYGKTYEGLIRSTVVVDGAGQVSLAQYNVRATGHVAKLRRDLGIS